MKVAWMIYFACMAFAVVMLVYIKKFRNPYRLTMFIGKKGAGKTTMIMKYIIYYTKHGWTCYCSVPMPGAYTIDPQRLGTYAIPPKSVILIDEASLLWDNRNFKTFSDDLKSYFRYQRQYKHKVFLFSQAFDVDLKLRNLCDELYIIRNILGIFSIAKRVEKNITVLSAKDDKVQESRIVDDLHYSPLIFAPFGGVKLTFIPKYTKYFKSFNPPELIQREYKFESAIYKRKNFKELLQELRSRRVFRKK